VNLFPAAIGLIMAIANFDFKLGGLEFGGVTVGTVTALVLYHLMKAIGKARGTDFEPPAIAAEFETYQPNAEELR
jgi:NCS2 family nucleobase:cation symporter-2